MAYLLATLDEHEFDLSPYVTNVSWGMDHPRGSPGLLLNLTPGIDALMAFLPILKATGVVRFTYSVWGNTPGLTWRSAFFLLTEYSPRQPSPYALLLQAGPEQKGMF